MTILILAIGVIIFGALDYVFLAIIAKDFYLKHLGEHTTIQNGSLVPYLPAVPLVYIVAVVGIWFFVLRSVTTLTEAILYGAFFGFTLYAFYDLTNLAILKNYSWPVTLADITWGTFAVAVVSGVLFFLKSHS